MKNNLHFLSYLARFFLEWGTFQTKVVEKMKTHILCSVTFFFLRKSCRVWGNLKKWRRARQTTDDNMAYAHCMLDTHTLTTCNTSCFSTATMVARTRLSVTLRVQCLYCCYSLHHTKYVALKIFQEPSWNLLFYLRHFGKLVATAEHPVS